MKYINKVQWGGEFNSGKEEATDRTSSAVDAVYVCATGSLLKQTRCALLRRQCTADARNT